MSRRPGGASNLSLRIVTAVIGIPLVLLANYLGGIALGMVVAVVAVVGIWELYGLFRGAGYSPAYLVGVPAAAALAVAPIATHESERMWTGVIVAALLAAGAYYLAPGAGRSPLPGWALTVAGILYVGLLLGHLTLLRSWDRGAWWVVLVLLITWAYDTGAYFTGRFAGKTPFMHHISPSKTLEGVGGGLAAAAIAGLVGVPAVGLSVPAALALGAGGGAAAQVGDLVESMIKRQTGAKDSGTIIPGHGGLLDRIDSLLFTAALTAWVARAMGYGA